MPKWMFWLGGGATRLGQYPACEHLNCALDYLLDDKEENLIAIEEICNAIIKSGGYFKGPIASRLAVEGFGGFVRRENVR